MWTLTATHHDASSTALPSLDEYSREAPEYESKRPENEKEKKHIFLTFEHIE